MYLTFDKVMTNVGNGKTSFTIDDEAIRHQDLTFKFDDVVACDADMVTSIFGKYPMFYFAFSDGRHLRLGFGQKDHTEGYQQLASYIDSKYNSWKGARLLNDEGSYYSNGVIYFDNGSGSVDINNIYDVSAKAEVLWDTVVLRTLDSGEKKLQTAHFARNSVKAVIQEIMTKSEAYKYYRTEIHARCNSCGKLSCFTFQEMESNDNLRNAAKWSYVGSLGSVLFGTTTSALLWDQRADKYLSRIVDYSKCPACGSTNLTLTCEGEEGYSAANTPAPAPTQTVVQQVSSADEIVKFKNLLDQGIITQEEFEAKKKELLGL